MQRLQKELLNSDLATFSGSDEDKGVVHGIGIRWYRKWETQSMLGWTIRYKSSGEWAWEAQPY